MKSVDSKEQDAPVLREGEVIWWECRNGRWVVKTKERDVVVDYLCRAADWEIFPGALALLEAHPENDDDPVR